MKSFNSISFALTLSLAVLLGSCQAEKGKPADNSSSSRAYYLSNAGNDNNDGSKANPWKSLSKIKGLQLQAGDSVLLAGGQTFAGTLQIGYNTTGTADKPVVIASYGGGQALIQSGNAAGLVINNSQYLQLQNLRVNGAGRKDGNTTSGISIAYSGHISIDNIEVAGYQKSGLLIRNCSDITVQNVSAHDNGYAGIAVDGENAKQTDSRNITISHCRAENNPGDPSNRNNHSGNGIIVSQCTGVRIAYCTATNNGWDMPRTGNGPVGIWAWDADSLVIEHCLAYRNKTSPGGGDGGGFDLDGGVTNSIIQYCLSYENEGSGIGLFEYDQAKPWYNNTIRYNISINDGNVSAAKAGIYIWNASTTQKLKDCFIYNNTIYNTQNAAISYASESVNEGFVFYNNILAGKKEIITGTNITGKYLGNCWWSITNGFNVSQVTNYNTWASQQQQESLNGNKTGINVDPGFIGAGNITITDATQLSSFLAFKAGLPVLLNGGIGIQQVAGIPTGGKDFNGNAAPVKGIGASF